MLNKAFLLFFLLICTVLKSNAQVLQHIHFGTLNAAGASTQSGAFIYDWNLGTLFTSSFSDDRFLLLTSGFIQSKELAKILSPAIDSLLELDKNSNLISIYPNPATHFIFILNPQNEIKIININLYSIKGELLKKIDAPYSTTIYNKMISLSNFVAGTYIFSINYIIAGKFYRTKLFRIIKI